MNLIGKRFGKLIVLQMIKHNKAFCMCDCGTKKIILKTSLTRKKRPTLSCGCIHKEDLIKRNTTHGLSKTRGYKTWLNMMKRCYDPNCSSFEDYGLEGIKVAKCWHNVETFLKDMGQPKPKMELDRIDCDHGYSPWNCRWATKKQNQLNRINTRWVIYEGEEMCAMDCAKLLNIPYSSFLYKLNNNNGRLPCTEIMAKLQN